MDNNYYGFDFIFIFLDTHACVLKIYNTRAQMIKRYV